MPHTQMMKNCHLTLLHVSAKLRREGQGILYFAVANARILLAIGLSYA